MRSLIKHLAPDRFEDLMALVALYRPGLPNAGMHVEYAERKHVGGCRVTYPHEDLEDILSGTYGIMVYQEQVMQIAAWISGYSMAEADTLHAMGKKIRAKLMVHREKFIEGRVANGYPSRLGRTCSSSWSRSPTTGSTRRTRARTATSRTRPRT